MARPAALQFLRKGVLLVGKVFPTFVDTWNWLVFAFDNLKGDGDLNGQNGYIRVDRVDPDRPVIRFDASKLPQGGGSSAFNVVGTDGTSEVVGDGTATHSLSFASSSNSNVTATVSKSGNIVTVTLGVYYL